MKKLRKAKLTYEKTLLIETDYPNSFDTMYINYRTYNFNPKAKVYKKEGKHYEK